MSCWPGDALLTWLSAKAHLQRWTSFIPTGATATIPDMCPGVRPRIWRVWRAGGGGQQPLRQPTLQQPGAPPPRDDQLQPWDVHAHAAQRPGESQSRRRCVSACLKSCNAGPLCGCKPGRTGAPDNLTEWTGRGRQTPCCLLCRHARRFLWYVLTACGLGRLGRVYLLTCRSSSSSPPPSRPAAARIHGICPTLKKQHVELSSMVMFLRLWKLPQLLDTAVATSRHSLSQLTASE